MTSRTRAEDLEPLSPELVLVSSPELAQVAREQLSSPAAAVVRKEPDEYSAPAYEVSPAPPRPMPPPYPRPAIVQPAREPERRRPRTRAVTVVVAVAALAAAGGVAALAWAHFLSTSKNAQPAGLPSSEARVTTTLAAGAPAATASAPTKTALAVPARPLHQRKPHERRPRKPTGAKPPSAAATGVFVPGRTWGWSRSKGASAYLVRFFLNGREVFKARTQKNRLVLPRSFRFSAGRYRWTVRPATGPPSKGGYGHTTVDSSFVLTPALAVRANRG